MTGMGFCTLVGICRINIFNLRRPSGRFFHELRFYKEYDKIIDGKVAEWLKALVLKTRDGNIRRFESCPFRHNLMIVHQEAGLVLALLESNPVYRYALWGIFDVSWYNDGVKEEKKMKSVIWGIVLVVVGVLLAGNATGLFDVNVFFDGWWTLFIIVPCTVGLITEKGARYGNLIGVIVGVLLLLACQDVIDFSLLWKLLVPGIIIMVGLGMIFKNAFNKKINEEIKKLNDKIGDDEIGAVFSGQNIDMKGEKFTGKKVSAVFGGLKLDLRKAVIKEDAVIDASAIFGGIDILVPDDVVVKVKSNALFGGVKSKHDDAKEGAPVVYVNGTAMFGGIEIK